MAMIYRALLLTLLYAISVHGAGFSVRGTTIYDSTGKPFIMRGINYAYAWYKSDLQTTVSAIAATNANVMRVVLADGAKWDKVDAASVEQIISLLSANKIITMLEVHDGTGSDDVSLLEGAVNYWIEIASVLKGKEDRVIINIANEWYSQDNADAWGNAYKDAIKKLRNAGLSHLIVVDAAGWGQNSDVIPSAGPAIFAADTLSNTVFSIHMYEVAGKDAAIIKKGIDSALAINIPVIVGEFSIQNNGQAVDLDDILSYTQQTSVGWIAWSWYGNNEAALDMATGAGGPLTSYGEKIVNGPTGLKATAVPAGVFN